MSWAPWQERLFWRTLYALFMYARHGRFAKEKADELEKQLSDEWYRDR